MQTFCTKNTLAKLARCDVRTISREPNAMMFLGTKRVPIYLADVAAHQSDESGAQERQDTGGVGVA